MDLLSAKLRIMTVIVGVMIAGIASAIILAVLYYFFGATISFSLIFLILIAFLVLDIIQWLLSPYFIGFAYHLSEIKSGDPSNAWILDVVSKVAQSSGIRMPRVFIAEVGFPNAFAYSSPVAGKRVAITRPLLSMLNREELEAVLAHEVGHLKHRDVELLFAIGLIPTLIFYLAYALIFSGRNRQQGGYTLLIAVLLMVVSFIFNIMILGVNRMRESYADINAVRASENGAEHLQTALAKIVASTGRTYRRSRHDTTNNVTNMLLFSDINSQSNGGYMDLLSRWKSMKVPAISSLFSSHPHPAKRIQMLERYRQAQ